MRLRSALGAPFSLASIDLLAAVAIAIIALAIVAGPVLSQDPGPSASPEPITTVTAAPILTAAPSETPGPTPTHSLPPGATSDEDPCAPTPTPEPTPTPDPNATLDPNATPSPEPTRTPDPNLCPAQPGANPIDLLAWVFTPVFQTIFIGLAFLYSVTGDIGTAIILLTIILRILLIPVFRAQIVSQRRMQMLQPELRAIQQKYKGDRARISQEQMQLYKDRGVNPASGCLPAVLQMALLLPMYQVFMRGLKAPDISSMLSPFGFEVVQIQCQDPGNPYVPCIDPHIWWLAWIPKIDETGFHMPGYPGGLPANEPEIFLSMPFLFGFGLSLLALASAALQLIQTRMMMSRGGGPADAQQATQNRMFLLLPAFSLIYGFILPAGLFIYWITTTVFSIVQQFLINGFGGLFPLFGWTPGIAKDYQPRFPVSMPAPKPPKPPQPDKEGTPTKKTTKRSTQDSAAGTIRPARRRSRRRGRRR